MAAENIKQAAQELLHEAQREESSEDEKYLGISKFNKPTKIYCPKDTIIYEKVPFGYKNDVAYFDCEYKIYKASVGNGNKPIFIFAKVFDKIDLGENSVYLEPISKDDLKDILKDMQLAGFLFEFCKESRISLPDEPSLDEVSKIILERHNNRPLVFRKTLAIPRNELSKIKDFYELSLKCISAGVVGDKNLDDTYISFIPEVNPEKINPKTFMKSANHSIILTNAGVKKTTNANIITGEPTIADCSSANLLGYGLADKKVSGKLDGRSKATIIDEIQEFKDDEVLGRLHTYMEQGECDISKGVGVKCRGHSAIVFQGNPKKKIENDETLNSLYPLLLLKQYRDFLSKISSNIQPFSRRIGEVDVGLNFKAVKGAGVNEERIEQGQQIIRTIAEGFRDEFTALLKNEKINDWLSMEYDEQYISQVDSLLKKCQDPFIREFLEGQKLNFRHSRGGAVRRAWLKIGIAKVMENEELDEDDIKEILETAETFFISRVARNLKSYATIIDLIKSEAYEQITMINLKSLKPEYAKITFYCLFEYFIKNNPKDKIVPIALLEEGFNILKSNNMSMGAKYDFFSRVREAFVGNVGHFSFFLEEYGIDYDKSLDSFLILKPIKLNETIEVYKKCKVQ